METIDTLYSGSVKLVQRKDSYRFSIDPVLLADFVTLRGDEHALDLGTGCGILALLLARRSPGLSVVGWERQEQVVERASRSIGLSGLAGQVSVACVDLREHRDLAAPGCYDLIVTNPPYREPGRGHIAPGDERAASRHELAGGLNDFLAAAGWGLKYRGRFAIVYLAERLTELLAAMTAVGIEPKRLRMVHPRQGEPARMVLVEGLKGGNPGLKIEPPLYVYKGDGESRDYTDEVMRIYGD